MRVTGKTGRRCILIAVYPLVLISHMGRVIVFMAVDTAEIGKIVWGDMAFYTFTPFVFMLSTVNPEILLVMVKGRWRPGVHIMTVIASCRVACCCVVRAVGRIVIARMTTEASVGCVVVITIVAGSAVVRNGSMRTA